MANGREHDLVVYGATGFVGALTAAHLAEHAPPGSRIALAGRSRDKLAAVRRDLPPSARDWPLIEADATDPASLTALAGAARVGTAGAERGLVPGQALWLGAGDAGVTVTPQEPGTQLFLASDGLDG